MYPKKLFLCVFALLLLAGCQDEPKSPSFDEQLLYGRWNLQEALRNNRKTETLTGTFYEFEPNGVMHTNFTPDQNMTPGEFAYEFDGRTITRKDDSESYYQVDSLSQSTLILSTTYGQYQFKFTLNRVDSEQLESEKEM